jgi:hypothetical protein
MRRRASQPPAGGSADARPDAEMMVVAASWEAADDLVRGTASASGARFGTRRLTSTRLAARLAAPALARAGRAPASRAPRSRPWSHAPCTRSTARAPFPTSRRRARSGLRDGGGSHARRAPHERRRCRCLRTLARGGVDLAALAARVEQELDGAALADRAAIYAAAVAAADATPTRVPLLLLDLPLTSTRDTALVAALARTPPQCSRPFRPGTSGPSPRWRARSLHARPRSGRRGTVLPLPSRTHLFEESTPSRHRSTTA